MRLLTFRQKDALRPFAPRFIAPINRPYLCASLIALGAVMGITLAGCGGGDSNPQPSPSPSVSASPTVPVANRKVVSFDVTWGSRTRGYNAAGVNSAQSAIFTIYEGGVRSDTPTAVVRVNRDARTDSYTAVYTTGSTTVDANKVCLVDAIFYAFPDQVGANVAAASMQTRINPDTGALENAIAVTGNIKNVELIAFPTFIGETSDIAVSTKNEFGTLIPVTPGSIRLNITAGEGILSLVTNEPLRVLGIRPGSATLTAIVDGVTSAPSVVSVTSRAQIAVAPTDPVVSLEGQVQLTATVAGVPSGTENQRVTWSVLSPNGGAVSPTGLYTAPRTEGTFLVQAQSVFDTTKNTTVAVRVASGVIVTVTPSSPTVAWGESVALSAAVSLASDQGVTWRVEGANAGTITPAGVYTAPQTDGVYTVVATSTFDPNRNARISVNVVNNTTVALTPTTVNLSWLETTTFSATVTNAPEAGRGVVWSVEGGQGNGTITDAGVYTAPKKTGTYTIIATSVYDGRKIATASVNVESQVAVTITPNENVKVNVNETVSFVGVVTRAVGNTGVFYSVENGPAGVAVGSINSDGVYTAPSKRGTYFVRATSQFDQTKFVRVPVQVTAGGAGIDIN